MPDTLLAFRVTGARGRFTDFGSSFLGSANLPLATIRNADLITNGCLGVAGKNSLENTGLHLCEHLIQTTNVSISNVGQHSPTLADL